MRPSGSRSPTAIGASSTPFGTILTWNHGAEILYGYRYRRLTCPGQGIPPLTRTTITGIVDPCDRNSLALAAPLGPNPIPIDVGALDGSVVRDTRDNPLNATRGSFIGLNLSYAPRVLGSDFDYLRELLQASVNLPVGQTMTWSQRVSIGTTVARRR